MGRRRYMTLIIDPPATGLTEGVRKAITDLAPETLIYGSCNPPTLARDLKELQHKFEVNSVTPLDMFPQPAEIEVRAHLEAQKYYSSLRDNDFLTHCAHGLISCLIRPR